MPPKRDDKQDYREILQETNTVTTGQSAAKLFSKILARTGDEKLKNMVQTAHDDIIRTLGLSGLKSKGDLRMVPSVKPILAYCKQVLEKDQPAWQQIAIAKGWTPPKSE